MASAYLQGSYQATSSATIRLTRTDTADTVDWTVSEGDTWNSGDEMLAEWTAVIQADGNFGSGFSFTFTHSTSNHYSQAFYNGDSAGTVTWSASGNGTGIRDFLGAGSGATTSVTDGNPVATYMAASYVASVGLTRAHRGSTTRQRGQFLAIAGNQMTQHHTDYGDADVVTLDVELWSGDSSGYTALERFEEFVDELFDGAGEPFSLFAVEDDGTSYQWVLRFADRPLRIVPERVADANPDRLWRIGFRAVGEVVPW